MPVVFLEPAAGLPAAAQPSALGARLRSGVGLGAAAGPLVPSGKRSTRRRRRPRRTTVPVDIVDQGEDSTTCPACGDVVASKRLRTHMSSIECQFRVVSCGAAGCGARMAAHELAAHRQRDCVAVLRRDQLVQRRLRAQVQKCDECGEAMAGGQTAHRKLQCAERLVACPNAGGGCPQRVVWRDRERHALEDCAVAKKRAQLAAEYRRKGSEEVACEGCGGMVLCRDLRNHLRDSCDFREVPCPLHCGESVPHIALQEHVRDSCRIVLHRDRLLERQEHKGTTMVPCPQGCGAELAKALVATHAKLHCGHRFEACGCGADVHVQDRHTAHIERDVAYASHTAKQCALVLRREKLAQEAISRNRQAARVACALGCGERLARAHLREHATLRCPNRKVACKYTHVRCNLGGRELRACDVLEHETHECPGGRQFREQIAKGLELRRVVPCPNACGASMPRKRLHSHVAHACPARVVPCKLGCGESVPGTTMDQHVTSEFCAAARARDLLARKAYSRKTGWARPWAQALPPGAGGLDGGGDGDGDGDGDRDDDDDASDVSSEF